MKDGTMNGFQRVVFGCGCLAVAVILFTFYPKNMVAVANPRYDPSFRESMAPAELKGVDRFIYVMERTSTTFRRHEPDADEVAVRFVAPVILASVALFVGAGARGSRNP
jgi:hypothetical protein